MPHLSHRDFILDNEIAQLKLNERVLNEALDETVPLLERLKSVTEFYNRMEKLYIDNAVLYSETNEKAFSLTQETRALMDKGNRVISYIDSQLEEEKIIRIEAEELTGRDLIITDRFVEDHVSNNVAVRYVGKADTHPANQDRICILCQIADDDEFALVEIGDDIPGICVLDYGVTEGRCFRYVLTETLVKMYAASIIGRAVVWPVTVFKFNSSGRILLDRIPERSVMAALLKLYHLKASQVYTAGILNYDFVNEMIDKLPLWQLKKGSYPEWNAFNQLRLGYGRVIDRVRRKEILSVYPYDAIIPLITLLDEAALDGDVSDIIITLNSKAYCESIKESLIKSASRGVNVNVIISSSETDAEWIGELDLAGCIINESVEISDADAGICQIIFSDDVITYICTGSIDECRLKTDTDVALFTADRRIADSVGVILDGLLAGASEHKHGTDYRDELITLIDGEAEKGEGGFILLKLNKLTDERIVEGLVNAAVKGCEIRIVCSDVCRLIPGIHGYTDRVRIVNVRGRINEHSRVLIVGKDRTEKCFLLSHDLTSAELDNCHSIQIPVYGSANRDRIKRILVMNYVDNVYGRAIDSKGSYVNRIAKGHKSTMRNSDIERAKAKGIQLVDSQQLLIDEAGV